MKEQAMSDEQRAMSQLEKLIAHCLLLLTRGFYGSN
jgi:hypothetical protein